MRPLGRSRPNAIGGHADGSAARCDLRQIRQRASVTSRVEDVDTIVRSAAILPPFQRWKLVAIPRSPGGTELTISASGASRIHAALKVAKSAIGSACVVVEAPVALRCRSSVGRSRRLVICRRAGLDRGAKQDCQADHQEVGGVGAWEPRLDCK
jgi:hypothetical protein